MKPTTRLFKCPYCSCNFWHSLSVSPEPDVCPLCCNTGDVPDGTAEYPSQREPEPFAGAPAMHLSGKTKATDNYITAMEEGAAFRTNLLVENHGFDREEARALEGTDVTQPPPPPVNEVSRASDTLASSGMTPQQLFAANPSIRSGAAAGPEPFAGMKAVTGLRARHGASGNVVVDSPAVEVGMRDQLLASATPSFRRR